MKRLWRWIIGDWWVVKRSGWPYPDGWATYNRKRCMILDTGLSREKALEECARLNARP